MQMTLPDRVRTLIRCASAAVLMGLLAAGPTIAAPAVELEPVVEGLSQPVFVTHAGDGSGRLFLVEQAGRILILDGGRLRAEPFLDLRARVQAGGERGLLGLAFHPEFALNGRYFVHYTRKRDGASVIWEYVVSADPNRSLRGGRLLLRVAQPFANHNGGMLAFGKGGRLFIGLGDGGAGGDPGDRAQDPDQLLGKILRIDIEDARPYAIPDDNPFAAGGGRPEIYALGLRNPWRFSFDRGSWRLFVGDVGQSDREEIDLVRRGRNYGWPILEGTRCFRPPQDCPRAGLTPPLTEYRHVSGRCSVTGGYVYRGRAIPELEASYVFGDFCSGEIFGLARGRMSMLLDTDLLIASFGEDEAGELLVVDRRAGAVHRIVTAAP
jgi:glucose/arabinose dehydrogenase